MSRAYRFILEGSQQVPGVVSSASGLGTAVFDSATNSLLYTMQVTGLDWGPFLNDSAETGAPGDNVTDAHFHSGARGANGGVIMPWLSDVDDFTASAPASGTRTISGRWETTDPVAITGFIAAFNGGVLGSDIGVYANIHTAAFGGGELRGQFVTIATDSSESIDGTSGNDYLPGLDGNDTIQGGAGNDTILGGAGADTLYGGAGNDRIETGLTLFSVGGESIFGGDGNDTLIGQAANTLLIAEGDGLGSTAPGDDLIDLMLATGGTWASGGAGNDTIFANGPYARVYGGDGSDRLIITSADSNTVVYGDGWNTTGGPAGAAPGDDYIELINNQSTLPVVRAGGGNDTIIGFGIIYAEDGNDSIVGGGDVYAGNGNDTVVGNGDPFVLGRVIFGGDGNDSLAGSRLIYGEAGNDTIIGEGDTFDEFRGGAGADSIVGDDRGDKIYVDADDVFFDGGGNYFVEGFAFYDYVIWDDAVTGANFDMAARHFEYFYGNITNDSVTAVGATVRPEMHGGGGDDTLSSAGSNAGSWLLGENGNDVLVGSAGIDYLDGGEGNDSLIGSLGINNFDGGAGDDTFEGVGTEDFIVDGAGIDLVRTAIASFTLGVTANSANVENLAYTGAGSFTGTGSSGENTITGGTQGDTLSGAGGNDRLEGAGGGDNLNGGDGNDTLSGGAGADTLDGGAGTGDALDYSAETATVYVHLDTAVQYAQSATGAGGAYETDTLAGIEILNGGSAGDYFYSGSGAERITGNAGNDYIAAGAGNDTISGGSERDFVDGSYDNDSIDGGDEVGAGDFLYGGANNDTINGGAGNDRIYGGHGADSLNGGSGVDILFIDSADVFYNGGIGIDYIVWQDVAVAANVNLAAHSADYFYGYTGNDVAFATGAGFRIELHGADGNDTLYGGGDGGSILLGENGDDRLVSDIGQDYMVGGAGADTFVFGPNGGTDYVYDFKTGGADKIDFTALAGAGVHSLADMTVITIYGAGSGWWGYQHATGTVWLNTTFAVGGAQPVAGDFLFV